MYQEVCFNRGTEAEGEGGVNVGHSLRPPSHFMLAKGLWGLGSLLSGQLIARWPVCPQVKQRGWPSLVLWRGISSRCPSFLRARPRMRASKCRSFRDWILSGRSSFNSWMSLLWLYGLASAATEDWLLLFCGANLTFGSTVCFFNWPSTGQWKRLFQLKQRCFVLWFPGHSFLSSEPVCVGNWFTELLCTIRETPSSRRWNKDCWI